MIDYTWNIQVATAPARCVVSKWTITGIVCELWQLLTEPSGCTFSKARNSCANISSRSTLRWDKLTRRAAYLHRQIWFWKPDRAQNLNLTNSSGNTYIPTLKFCRNFQKMTHQKWCWSPIEQNAQVSIRNLTGILGQNSKCCNTNKWLFTMLRCISKH